MPKRTFSWFAAVDVMELSIITAKQVFMLFILIFGGFLAVKFKAIKPEGKKAFSDLLLYLVVPCMVVNSYIMEFNFEILKNLLVAFAMSAIVMVVGLVVVNVLTFRKKEKNTKIVRFACTFSNAAYMGFPLVQALFGSEGMIYASAYVTVFNIIIWTYGYAIMSGKNKPKDMALSIFKNPVIYSVIVGILIYLLQIPLPNVLQTPIKIVGDMNTPVSMIITGMIIAQSDIKKLLKIKEIYAVLLIRMVVIPVVCLLLALLIDVEGIVFQVVFLLEMCPCAALTSVFSVQFGHNENMAAGCVVFSTLLSIFSLPIYAAAIQAIM